MPQKSATRSTCSSTLPTFCSVNMRSLCNKLQDFSHFVLEKSLTVVAVTETWFQKNYPDSFYSINGYNLFRQDRNGRGGGVALYVAEHIRCNVLQLNIDYVSSVEYLLAKIKIGRVSVGVAVVYRPDNLDPGNLNILSDIIICLQSSNIDKLLILGDFNVNLLEHSPSSGLLKEILFQHECEQIIAGPTRITKHTESLLDLVITNLDNDQISAEVSDVCFSDHNAILGSIRLHSDKPTITTKYVRSFKNFNIDLFSKDAAMQDWNVIYQLTSLEEKVDYFNTCILNLFDRHAPLANVSIRSDRRCNPWFTDTLHSIRRLVRKAWARYTKSRCDSHRRYFCELRNYYNFAIVQEKRAYFSSQIGATHGDNKKLWQKLKEWDIAGGLGKSKLLPDNLQNPTEINDFFMTAFSSTVPDSISYSDYISHFKTYSFSNSTSFNLILPDIENIESIVLKLKPNIAGSDGISGRMLQLALPFIGAPLTHIINSSFERGMVPAQWKICSTFPILKKKTNGTGDGIQLEDLRPITILPVCLKIAETVVCHQLTEYVRDCGILPDSQSGFRKNYSTSSALCKVVDDLIKARDAGHLTSLTLLDLSKAFDRVMCECLLAKLRYYGIQDVALSWTASYLRDRLQYTVINTSNGSVQSDGRLITSGVPQGSVLGPLLFSLYISDLTSFVEHCSLHLYADDIQLYLSFNPGDADDAAQKINSDLAHIYHWTSLNCLTINPNKCHNIMLGSKHSLSILSSLKIFIDQNEIPYTNSVVNLGVTFDGELSFSNHVSQLCRKAFFSLRQLMPFKYLLSSQIKLLITESLVLSLLNYCDCVYGPCISCMDAQRLQKIQNSCIRFVTYVPPFTHVTPHMRRLGCLRIQERRMLHYVVLVVRVLSAESPNYLYRSLHKRSSAHELNLRRVDEQFTVPAHKTEFFKSSFSYLAVYILNHLPPDVKGLSIYSLKKFLKDGLLSGGFSLLNVNLF